MKRNVEVADHLGQVALFSKCSKRDLTAVAKHAEVISFEAGATIVAQGQAGDAFFVVLDGVATVRRNGRKVGELGAGDYFGELALLDPAPRNADVIAAEPITVARLLVGPFRSVLNTVPAINERLLAGLARRVRDADRRVVE
jgi:CRP/FNR family transcriptional regulator, cyclic AMP receptor protein